MNDSLKPGFGNRLREERERLGFTQQEFAEQAGIKRVTQFLYEKEESFPSYRYLTAIAENGVDMHYLFFGRRKRLGRLDFSPDILIDIYRVVDEVARDDAGNLLPLESRIGFFGILCAAYAGRENEQIDADTVRVMLSK